MGGGGLLGPCGTPLVQHSVPSLPYAYSLVCITGASGQEVTGTATVEVLGRGRGVSDLTFAYQVLAVEPCPTPQPDAFAWGREE